MNFLAAPADISSKDLPLREDIRLLGRILGDTLREQEGEETFESGRERAPCGRAFSQDPG